jgi:type II secretory pathway pseudopilin PulG
MMMVKKRHGLSMLELLLWLAVVAVIMIAVGRFFKNDESSAEVVQAIERVKNVNQGLILYLQQNTPPSGQSFPNLVTNKYVSTVDVQTPWPASASPCQYGQSICPVINTTALTYYIYIASPPAAICSQFYNELKQAGFDLSSSSNCPAKQITITVSF